MFAFTYNDLYQVVYIPLKVKFQEAYKAAKKRAKKLLYDKYMKKFSEHIKGVSISTGTFNADNIYTSTVNSNSTTVNWNYSGLTIQSQGIYTAQPAAYAINAIQPETFNTTTSFDMTNVTNNFPFRFQEETFNYHEPNTDTLELDDLMGTKVAISEGNVYINDQITKSPKEIGAAILKLAKNIE